MEAQHGEQLKLAQENEALAKELKGLRCAIRVSRPCLSFFVSGSVTPCVCLHTYAYTHIRIHSHTNTHRAQLASKWRESKNKTAVAGPPTSSSPFALPAQ